MNIRSKIILPFLLLGFYSQALAVSDISNHKYEDSIQSLIDEGVISGYEDGTFRPEQKINRAEFTKILIESKSLAPKLCEKTQFPDVSLLIWYGPYVYRALCDEVIEGNPDGRFYPDRYINYAEASKIISKNFDLSVTQSSTGLWYTPYVSALASKGAQPRTNIKPADFITRGEMAYMVNKIRPKQSSTPTPVISVGSSTTITVATESQSTPVTATQVSQQTEESIEMPIITAEVPTPSSTTTTQTNQELEEGKWYFVSLPKSDPTSSPYDLGTWISFQNSKVSGEGACNSFFGTYALNESHLEFEEGLASTKRGCFKDEAQERETQLLKALSLVRGYQVKEDRILLTDESQNTVLILSRHSIIE